MKSAGVSFFRIAAGGMALALTAALHFMPKRRGVQTLAGERRTTAFQPTRVPKD